MDGLDYSSFFHHQSTTSLGALFSPGYCPLSQAGYGLNCFGGISKVSALSAGLVKASEQVGNASQQVHWAADYEPFGQVTIANNTEPQNLRFPGQYYDSETGLSDNWHRTYDPATGRYLQSDPIGLLGGINTYAYAYQNPLTFVDPDGQLAWVGTPAVAGAVVGAVSGGVGAWGAGATPLGVAAGVATGAVVGGAAGIEAGVVATIAIGAGAAAVGETVSQLITEGHIDGDKVGVAALLGGWTAGASLGLTAVGVPLWPATALPAAMDGEINDGVELFSRFLRNSEVKSLLTPFED